MGAGIPEPNSMGIPDPRFMGGILRGVGKKRASRKKPVKDMNTIMDEAEMI
jgi:hypothetical protein